jgi:hypothetical protein
MENNAFKTFDLVPKSVRPTFGTRSKVVIMVFLAFKTFDLVFKVVRTDFGTRSKVENKPKIPVLQLLIWC